MNSVVANLFSSQTISPASFPVILLSMVLALLAGVFIAWIYRRNYRGVMYSNNFALTLIMMTLITCPVVMCIRESIQLSMGMVGALSIVRFRNAVKSPLDLLYIFWAVSAGIMCGVGLVVLALFLCAAMTLLVVLLQFVPGAKTTSVVVLRSAREVDWNAVKELLQKHGKNVKEKSRSRQAGQTEVIYELFTREEDQLIAELEKLESIEQIHFLSHDGEYRI